jgi:hypothetical protein
MSADTDVTTHAPFSFLVPYQSLVSKYFGTNPETYRRLNGNFPGIQGQCLGASAVLMLARSPIFSAAAITLDRSLPSSAWRDPQNPKLLAPSYFSHFRSQ